jgi:hypothetical protein
VSRSRTLYSNVDDVDDVDDDENDFLMIALARGYEQQHINGVLTGEKPLE